MKLFKLAALAVIALAVVPACKKESWIVQTIDGNITCFRNKHTCLGIANTPYFKPDISGEFTFKSGTDYQNAWSQPDTQVNKLFGATDCGDYIPSRENSAMVGFRHIQNTDTIELLGYAHREDAFRNGYNFRHASLAVVPRFQAVKAKISVMGSYYRFQTDGASDLIMKRYCGDSKFNGRKIAAWFGGQKPAPQDLHIDHSTGASIGVQFPRNLQIMDQDGLCSKRIDPIAYLKDHDSGIYSVLNSECGQGHLLVKVLGCDGRRVASDPNAPQENSAASDPGFRYWIECQV